MSLVEDQRPSRSLTLATPPASRPQASGDLRLPLLAALLIALGLAALTRLPVALAALAAAAILAAASGARPRAALHRMAHVEGFLIVLLLILPFSTPGQPVLQLGPLTASAEGLTRAALIGAKVNAVALALLALLPAAAPERLGRALLALGAPTRFVMLLQLILRHSHTARDSLRRQSEAMRARAFRPATSLHCWHSYGHLIGGALLRAFARAERVEEAMRLRGAGKALPASLPPLSPRAWASLALTLAIVAAFVLADRLG